MKIPYKMETEGFHLIKILRCLILIGVVVMLFAVPAMAAENVASGNCGDKGDNVTWTLDSEGRLTISGSGDMRNYNRSSPWYDYTSNVKTVIINKVLSILLNKDLKFCIKFFICFTYLINNITYF